MRLRAQQLSLSPDAVPCRWALPLSVNVSLALPLRLRCVEQLEVYRLLIHILQPLSFAVVSEVLPHRHRLAGQASINAVSQR